MKNRLTIVAVVLTLAACAQTRVPPPKSPDFYLQEGEKFFEQELYEDAIASWEKVRDSYYSPELNTLAELKIAQAHYQAGNFTEAAVAYEDFLRQHPNHEKAPLVMYELGMSYYRQRLSADRDQTATRNALVTFQSLQERFPDFPAMEDVETLIRTCRDRLADHELYVGRYYLRTGHPQAARMRLEDLFRRFPAYSDADEALLLLGRAYLETGMREEAVDAFNILYREFPDSPHVPEAQEVLAEKY